METDIDIEKNISDMVCPVCGSSGLIYSEDNICTCPECGHKISLNENAVNFSSQNFI